MTSFFRKSAFLLAFVCLSLAFGAPTARADEPGAAPCVTAHPAKTHHAKKHAIAKTHPAKAKAKHAVGCAHKKAPCAHAQKGDEIVRIAQEHLAHLGYYTGKIDGIMGPATREAIKNFQREHGLKPDGVLGKKTRKALEDADHVMPSPSEISPNEPLTHEQGFVNPLNTEVDQDYQTPLGKSPTLLYTRFAGLEVNETGGGTDKRYTVKLNGQTLLEVNGQPSVIGISKTYDLGGEDAIIFTTFNPDSVLCSYENYVLVLNDKDHKLLEIENCTRAYQAQVNNNSLYISFPERDDNRVLGGTWRLEGMNLNRL